MSGSDHHDHEHHSSHPAAAVITALVITGIFALIFSLLSVPSGWTTPVFLATGIVALWGIVQVLVVNKD